MRPGLRESIEPSGADGGNVGARPGVEPCSGGLELVELGRIGSNWGELRQALLNLPRKKSCIPI